MIGKNVDVDLLKAVYPFSIPVEVLIHNLEELEAVGLLIKDHDREQWSFRSLLDRDTINEIVPQSQRRCLHAKVAAVLSCNPLNVRFRKGESSDLRFRFLKRRLRIIGRSLASALRTLQRKEF